MSVRVHTISRELNGEKKEFIQALPGKFDSKRCGYGDQCKRFIEYWSEFEKNVLSHQGTKRYRQALKAHQELFSKADKKCSRVHPTEFSHEYEFRTQLKWPNIPHGQEQYMKNTAYCVDYFGSVPLGRCKRKDCTRAHDAKQLVPRLCFDRLTCPSFCNQTGDCPFLHQDILGKKCETIEEWMNRTGDCLYQPLHDIIALSKIKISERRKKYDDLNFQLNGCKIPKPKKKPTVEVTFDVDESDESEGSESENGETSCNHKSEKETSSTDLMVLSVEVLERTVSAISSNE